MFSVGDPAWLEGAVQQRVTSPDGAVTITKCDPLSTPPPFLPYHHGVSVSSTTASPPPSSSSSDGGGSGGEGGETAISSCLAPVMCKTMGEMRARGSSFLRQHASKHGITNASRKLTKVVLEEIATHYFKVHKYVLVRDEKSQPTVEANPHYVAVKSRPPAPFRRGDGKPSSSGSPGPWRSDPEPPAPSGVSQQSAPPSHQHQWQQQCQPRPD